MATMEKSANFSGKTWGGYCRLTYTAGNGAISITGMAFKATNSTTASYGAHYDDNQTITISAGGQSKSKQIAKVKINSTSYQAATDSYSSSSFTAVSFSGLNGSTTVSFTVRARGASPNTLTFSYAIDAGSAVVKPTVSGLSVSAASENSINASFTINSNGGATATGHITCNGVTKTGTSATFTGLAAGTYYGVTAYASNSAGNSGTLSGGATTWGNPYVTSAPNFTIGDTISIPVSNSHSRLTTITIKYGSTTIRTLSTSSGSVSYNSSLDSAIWYSKIPNNPSGTYSVTSTYNGYSVTKSGTFYIRESECKPTFSNFAYEDVDSTTLALTGNSQKVIIGYSDIKATISTANKATAKNSASMSYYTYECGSATPVKINYSSSTDVYGTISNVSSNSFKVTATDTRNQSTAKTITVSDANTINYTPLSKTRASIERVGSVSSQTTLSFEGEYWNGNFGATTNALQSATYKYKTGSGDWTTGTTDITPTIDGNTFSFEGLVLGDDVENAGFNAQNVYTVVVTVTDKLSTAEWTLTLNSGTPHIAYYKDGIAIKGKYNENIGGKLQVDGKIIENIGGTIKISNSNRQTMQPNIYTTLDFNFTYFNLSNQLSRSGNAVVIGKGINVILATAQWTAWSPSNYGRYLYIKRIRNNVTQDFLFYSLQYSSTINSSAVITVQEGDKIIAGGYQENSSAITLEAYETRTFLQVTILG